MPVDTPYAGVASIFRSQVRQGRPPRVFEDGAQRRDFVHVSDIAEANLVAFRALGSGDVAAGVLRSYNVGSGEVRTILDLARAISAALEGPAPEVTGEFRLGDVRHITASSQRMADELGWHSRVRFDEGMTALARVAATTW
jgi:dTDP-L-rhamnose 4-epimerase